MMATIHRSRLHKRTSLDEAKAGLTQAVQLILAKVPGASEPRFHPAGHQAELEGVAFRAVLHVDQTHLHIEVRLSFPVSLMRSKVESEMDRILDEHLP